MNVVLNIPDQVIAGAAAGAGGIMLPVIAYAGLGAIAESFTSLGGTTGFGKTLVVGTAIYAPVGACIGALTVAAGAPWGVAMITAPVALVTFQWVYGKLRQR